MLLKSCVLFFSIILTYSLIPSSSYARSVDREMKTVTELPILSPTDMYEDFDFLISFITNTFCRIQVKKKLMHQDIEADLQVLRKKIQGIKTYQEFVLLVHQALIVTQDRHNFIIGEGMYGWDLLFDPEYKEKYSTLSKKQWDMIPVFKTDIPLVYYKGEYRVYSAFKESRMKIDQGDILLSVDGVNIHEYVRQLRWERPLMWDAKNTRFYDEQFFRCQSFVDKGTVKLVFKGEKGRIKNIKFNTDKALDFKAANYHAARESLQIRHLDRSVKFFSEHKTLYIRALSLQNQDSLIDSMLEYKNKQIDRIVFDFRDSPGGFTDFFPSLIRHIYDKSFYLTNTVGMKVINKNFEDHDNPRNKKGLSGLSKKGVFRIPVLDGEIFHVFTHRLEFESSINNLDYKAKVYILLNEQTFSSPTIVQYQALNLPQVVTVGQPSGWEQGEARGGFYEVAVLAHSKIAFQIVNGIDLSKYDTINDLYDNRVEIPVDNSWPQLLQRMYYSGDVYGTEYLLKYDSLMKQVFSQD